MDPFSITCGVITVIGATQQAIKCAKKLSAIRKAPAELTALLNEVTDLGDLLDQVAAATKSKANNASEPSNGQGTQDHGRETGQDGPLGLDRVIVRISSKLHQLDSLIQEHTSKNTKRLGIACGQLEWAKGRQKAKRLQEDLKLLRLNLANSLGASTLSAAARVESAIEQANIKHVESVQHLSTLIGELALPASPSPTEKAVPLYGLELTASPVTSQVDLTSLPPSYSEDMTRHRPRELSKRPEPTRAVQSYRKVATACNAWCSCRCHRKRVLRLQPPRNNSLGALTIAYSGLPWTTDKCDEHACRNTPIPSVSMTCQFPNWLWHRYLSTSLTYTPICGPEINLRMPRMIDWSSNLWAYLINGDMGGIQKLFAKGAASPWDVNPCGGSVLHYTVDHGHFELSKYLVSQGALIECGLQNTPTEMAWAKLLSGTLTAQDEHIVKSVFGDTDYTQTRAFTVLHKVVLDLLKKDLRAELDCSTKDIDATDSSGYTCVSWAAARGDHTRLQILLTYGADPNIADYTGSAPLHRVRNSTCCRILLEHGANINARNQWGRTALHQFCRCEAGDGSIRLLDTLIQSGADVNAIDNDGEVPLHNATLNRRALVTKHLLGHGADASIANSTGDATVHFATMFGARDILRLLLELGVDCTRGNTSKQSVLHLAAGQSDVEILRILERAHLESACLESIDICGLDASGKTARECIDGHKDHEDYDELRAVFERLEQSIVASRTQAFRSVDIGAALSKSAVEVATSSSISKVARGITTVRVTSLSSIEVDCDEELEHPTPYGYDNVDFEGVHEIFYDAVEDTVDGAEEHGLPVLISA